VGHAGIQAQSEAGELAGIGLPALVQRMKTSPSRRSKQCIGKHQ
jgi:hypothetical protein